jgi:F0F1-type ATP synthase membrane subunit b/b'
MDRIRAAFLTLVGDADSFIAGATEKAKAMLADSRQEVARVRQSVAELDRQSDGMMKLLLDPEMAESAKRAVKRQLGDVEAQREGLQKQLAALTDQTHDEADGLVKEIERTFAEIKQALDSATPEDLRDVITRYVGPLVMDADGTITGKREGPVDESAGPHQTKLVAGARSVQFRATGLLEDTFWSRFQAA